MNWKNTIALSALSLLLFACAQNGQTPTGTTGDSSKTKTGAAGTAPAPLPETTCYALTGTDTVRLQFTNSNGAVTGTLFIQRSGKDRNEGTISGTLKADTLLADYRFRSEGKTSTRQVAFLKKGDRLLEGFGPVEMKDGKTVFEDPSALTFPEKMPLQKQRCQ